METKETNEHFIDESGDRMYFTTIPNIIFDTCSAKESGVYGYIRKRTGENGEFFETQENAVKTLKMRVTTYRRILRKLIKDKRIEFVGRKATKTRPVDVYKITDIWKENVDYFISKRYRQKGTISVETQKDMDKREPLDMDKREPLIIDSNNNNQLSLNKDKSLFREEKETFSELKLKFSLEDEIKKLSINSRREMQIIGLWFQMTKDKKPENKEQYQSFLKRNLRPAKFLEGYSDDRIKRAYKICENTRYLDKFTLETLAKYIDSPEETRSVIKIIN